MRGRTLLLNWKIAIYHYTKYAWRRWKLIFHSTILRFSSFRSFFHIFLVMWKLDLMIARYFYEIYVTIANLLVYAVCMKFFSSLLSGFFENIADNSDFFNLVKVTTSSYDLIFKIFTFKVLLQNKIWSFQKLIKFQVN